MELYTNRLYLREFKKSDFRDVHSYASDLSNVKYTLFGPNTPKDTRHFLGRVIEESKDIPRRYYDFAIGLKGNTKIIGACGIYLRNDDEAEMGWILNKDYWDNNYMTEAAKALIEFGFTKLCLHRIYARCNTENIGSWRVMEKCSMQKEACFRQVRKLRSEPNGKWYDDYQYSILYDEYINSH